MGIFKTMMMVGALVFTAQFANAALPSPSADPNAPNIKKPSVSAVKFAAAKKSGTLCPYLSSGKSVSVASATTGGSAAKVRAAGGSRVD